MNSDAPPYRPHVVVARAMEWMQQPAVRDRKTNELLASLLDPAGLDPLAMDALARTIESGVLRDAATMPDEPSMDDVVPAAAVSVLAAAFEVTRRAALPHAPPVIRGPADVATIAQRELSGLPREHVIVVACDASNRPIRTVVVARGAVDRAALPIREVLNAVLRFDGRAFALAHNHPCGDPEPSESDAETTRRIGEASRLVGLRFLGHVVIGHGGAWKAA